VVCNPFRATHALGKPAIHLCEIFSVSVLRRPWSTVGSWYAVASGARRSASELHVLCSGLQKSIDAEVARGDKVGTPK
jgi:hypothetical protein